MIRTESGGRRISGKSQNVFGRTEEYLSENIQFLGRDLNSELTEYSSWSVDLLPRSLRAYHPLKLPEIISANIALILSTLAFKDPITKTSL
jgi:hypothetical protein